MSTRGDLKNEIIDDLSRTDMTSAASSAITSAIKHYEKERWYFLEATTDLTTSSSAAYYTLPSDLLDPDSMMLWISSQKQPIYEVPYLEMDRRDSGKDFGYPSEWAMYKDQIRFYPVPDDTYTITVSYHKTLNTSVSDSASNAWTNVAKDLIRHRAVKEICLSKIKDMEGGQVANSQEKEEYDRIKLFNLNRQATHKIRKTDW